jgi:hypothetical protein
MANKLRRNTLVLGALVLALAGLPACDSGDGTSTVEDVASSALKDLAGAAIDNASGVIPDIKIDPGQAADEGGDPPTDKGSTPAEDKGSGTADEGGEPPEPVDPHAHCELAKDKVVGSCVYANNTQCQEYYSDTADPSSTCTGGNTWTDQPCSADVETTLMGICKRETHSLWFFTDSGVPFMIKASHDGAKKGCEKNITGMTWCSIEDGSGIEPNCTQKTAAGMCDSSATTGSCNEYPLLSTAQATCQAFSGEAKPDTNCPLDNVLAWCVSGAGANYYYANGMFTEQTQFEAACAAGYLCYP